MFYYRGTSRVRLGGHAASSYSKSQDEDLKKAILGKWLGQGGQTIEFLNDGSVIAHTPDVVHGRYEVFGNDPTRVQQNEISVQMTDSTDALPLTAKLSSSTEMLLTKSTGETSKFSKAK